MGKIWPKSKWSWNTEAVVLSRSVQLCCRLANVHKEAVCEQRDLLCWVPVVLSYFRHAHNRQSLQQRRVAVSLSPPSHRLLVAAAAAAHTDRRPPIALRSSPSDGLGRQYCLERCSAPVQSGRTDGPTVVELRYGNRIYAATLLARWVVAPSS